MNKNTNKNLSCNIDYAAIENALSHKRLNTFVKGHKEPRCLYSALNLYAWNMHVGSAFATPLHVCEVVIRNSVNDALVNVYGDDWASNEAYIISIPDHILRQNKFRNKLKKAKNTSKLIPELNFHFWQSMFTTRFCNNIWNDNLKLVFPNAPKNIEVTHIHDSLDIIRKFRNRIAHHEHLLNQNLAKLHDTILQLIGYRCHDTMKWLLSISQLSPILSVKPKSLIEYIS